MDFEFISHWLNMDPNYALKKQKPHRSLDIHANVVKEEVDKLKEVRAIKEVLYIYIYIPNG